MNNTSNLSKQSILVAVITAGLCLNACGEDDVFKEMSPEIHLRELANIDSKKLCNTLVSRTGLYEDAYIERTCANTIADSNFSTIVEDIDDCNKDVEECVSGYSESPTTNFLDQEIDIGRFCDNESINRSIIETFESCRDYSEPLLNIGIDIGMINLCFDQLQEWQTDIAEPTYSCDADSDTAQGNPYDELPDSCTVVIDHCSGSGGDLPPGYYSLSQDAKAYYWTSGAGFAY